MDKSEFQFVLSAAIIADDGKVRVRFMHEYSPAPYGTRMRSTFFVPQKAPFFFVEALKRHNREEMANFQNFLPELYQREAG